MLLQNRAVNISVPHSSMCYVHTRGLINDGDLVSITSPIFASTDFRTGAIRLTETFDVRIRTNQSFFIDETNQTFIAELICDDNDIENMYVRIPHTIHEGSE